MSNTLYFSQILVKAKLSQHIVEKCLNFNFDENLLF
jgi:hypothetical protein